MHRDLVFGLVHGVTARELPGGHSPFLARPGDLADELLDAVAAHGLLLGR